MDILAHLKGRGFHPERYHFSYDEETACFFLYNLSGQWVGFQQYRPAADKARKNDPKDSRYYTHYERGRVAVWGLETFNYRTDVLFITEGVFDCVRLHNQGLPAIAALANDPQHLRHWLYALSATRLLVGVCDNDEAGEKLAKSVNIAIRLQDSKDLGDKTDEEVRQWMLNEPTIALFGTSTGQ